MYLTIDFARKTSGIAYENQKGKIKHWSVEGLNIEKLHKIFKKHPFIYCLIEIPPLIPRRGVRETIIQAGELAGAMSIWGIKVYYLMANQWRKLVGVGGKNREVVREREKEKIKELYPEFKNLTDDEMEAVLMLKALKELVRNDDKERELEKIFKKVEKSA